MTPQPNLQFADAKVTNDGTNNATVIQNFVDINWDDWQEVDDNDDTYYRVTDAPLVDGNVEVDLMKKLWENSAPSASFNAQNITLASDDYDYLLWRFRYDYSGSFIIPPVIVKKGENVFCSYVAGTSTLVSRTRSASYQSDTVYSIDNATQGTGTNNNVVIPIDVYGIKLKVTISLSAIISNVSTSASKCMLSDGETSVADALGKTNKLDYDNIIDLKSTLGTVNAEYTVPKDGILTVLALNTVNGEGFIVINRTNSNPPMNIIYDRGVGQNDGSTITAIVNAGDVLKNSIISNKTIARLDIIPYK
jgi:hypothetical protein